MIVHTFEQHTPEWLKVRLGKFTASKAKQLMSGIDTAGFQGIVNQVVYERLTGEAPEEFRSEWMVRGNELEFAAREAYENLTFRNVNQVGFGEMDEWTGSSPDGLLDEDGMVEIKCPKYSTLIDYLAYDIVPPEYMKQMQFNLMVFDRKWVDFFAWHPKIKPHLKRIQRDEDAIGAIKARLVIAIDLAKNRLTDIQSGKPPTDNPSAPPQSAAEPKKAKGKKAAQEQAPIPEPEPIHDPNKIDLF